MSALPVCILAWVVIASPWPSTVPSGGAGSERDTTAIQRSTGRKLFLHGRYVVEDTLLGRHALLFRASNSDPDRDLMCLDVGSDEPRLLHDAPAKR